MNKLTTITLLAVLLFAGVQTASAQFELGPRATYNLDAEELAVGAEARFGVGDFPVLIAPAAEYYLGIDGGSLIIIDVMALYEFGIDNEAFTPYAGAGLSYSRFDIDTGSSFVDGTFSDTSLGIVGGANFLLGNLKPFAQARIVLGDNDSVSVQGGLLFSFGGN